jgi:hypothetical protein
MAIPPPPWADTAWARAVSEPFRSDGRFWSGLAASADALLVLTLATVIGVVLTLSGAGGWALLAFAAPAALIVRAGVVSHGASRGSRATFTSRTAWREAEREAVAAVFFRVLLRHRPFGTRGAVHPR